MTNTEPCVRIPMMFMGHHNPYLDCVVKFQPESDGSASATVQMTATVQCSAEMPPEDVHHTFGNLATPREPSNLPTHQRCAPLWGTMDTLRMEVLRQLRTQYTHDEWLQADREATPQRHALSHLVDHFIREIEATP